jgi:hypothetical protein
MAKAGAEVTMPWREAVELLAGAYGPSLAERVLVKGAREERVRWTCRLFDGNGSKWALPTTYPGRSGKFWRYVSEIRGSENWARVNLHDGCIIGMITVVETDVRALLPDGLQPVVIATPQPAVKAAPKRPSPQSDRVLKVLPELYPPEGVVPSGVTIKTVWGKVGGRLDPENKQLGLGTPSADTVGRCVAHLRRLPS